MKKFLTRKDWITSEPEANFIFIDVKKHSKEVFEALMRKGVIVRPGFFWDGTADSREHPTMAQTEKFISCLKEVLNGLMKIENISQIAKKLGKQERAWEKPGTLAKIVKVLVGSKKGSGK